MFYFFMNNRKWWNIQIQLYFGRLYLWIQGVIHGETKPICTHVCYVCYTREPVQGWYLSIVNLLDFPTSLGGFLAQSIGTDLGVFVRLRIDAQLSFPIHNFLPPYLLICFFICLVKKPLSVICPLPRRLCLRTSSSSRESVLGDTNDPALNVKCK